MGGGLVIIEPTTIWRDWARTAIDLPEVWAGGWPQGNTATTGVVLEVIDSTLAGAITTWSTQWDAYATKTAGGQPAAAALAARLATTLARTIPRTVLGTVDAGQVLYGGLDEGSLSLFPVDEDKPDLFRHTLLVDLLTISVPTP